MSARRLSAAFVTVCVAFAAAAVLHAGPDAIVLVWQSDGAPADVADGVQMGAAEAQQTATLLGRTVRIKPHAAKPFATIAAEGADVALKAGGCAFRLSPSAAEKAALLAGWKQRTGKDGDDRIAVWHSSLRQFGGSDLNERFTRQFHTPMTEGAWLGWIAVKAAVEAALRANGAPCDAIGSLEFDGHKGALLSFRNRVLQQPLYVVEKTAAGEKVVAEVPER